MTAILTGIQDCFPDKFFNHASTQAVGVGTLCFIGLKIHRYDPKNPMMTALGKTVVGVSAVAGLYFSGVIQDHGESLCKHLKYGISIPVFGGKSGIGISLHTIREIFIYIQEQISSVFV